jgi:putative ABC transport system permease protein
MIGFFVIIISWLNYTIISTSMSLERAKEIGIEKVNGALRMDMIKNSMLETSCYCGIATLISIILIIVIQPLLNQFSGLTDSYSFLGELWFWLVLAGIFVLSSLFAGFYAALILSSYNPIVVLKGKLSHSKKGIILRKTLLVLQFSISIALTIATFVVYKQLQFMREKEIGMNIKNKLIIKSPKKVDRDSYVSSYRSFKNEIMRNNNLVSCACSVDIPGADAYQGLNFARLGANVGEVVQAKQNSVDFDFIPTYKIKMLSGRNFDPNISTNNVMIISRIFSEKLGFKHPQDAINMQVFRPSAPEVVNRIIGVFKEYNQVSPKIKIDPMYFVFSENRPRFFTVQFKGSMNAETISFIESKWKQIFPGNAFDYFILEDFYNKQFKKDQNFGKIFVIFTCLAIFITCLGLYGFSSYSTISKQKVIGIRKVMGANIFNIWQTFIREYFVLIGISMIISIPLIYYFMDRWLNSFADRIKLSAGIFFFPPLLVILVAIAAVSYHIVKISLINPIKSLKYE